MKEKKKGRLFRGKYRIETTRYRSWNYGWPGWYMVTVCTGQRKRWFGHIEDGRMMLSPAGSIAAEEWQKTPLIRPDVLLDEWQIMPDHIHGIIVIVRMPVDDHSGDDERPNNVPSIVETRRSASLRVEYTGNTFGPQSHNLSSIIRGYKASVTKRIREHVSPAFSWQSRFHDHIIGDHAALQRIRAYIRNNPQAWTAQNH